MHVYPVSTYIKQYPQPSQEAGEVPVALHYLQLQKTPDPSTQTQLYTQSHTQHTVWDPLHLATALIPALPSHPKYLAHLHIHTVPATKAINTELPVSDH